MVGRMTSGVSRVRAKLRTWFGRLSPTTWAAVTLAALAIVAWLVGLLADSLDNWAPNIVTEALSIAVTVAIVERIIRREQQKRLAPRVERVLWRVGVSFRSFVDAIALDYADSHYETFKEIPADTRDLIAMWLDEQENEDVLRTPLEGERLPMLVLSAQEFVGDLEQVRERDLDVMEPDLVRVVDDFQWRTAQAANIIGLAAMSSRPVANSERIALKTVVNSADAFASVFRRYQPQWMEVMQLMRDAAREHSRQNAPETYGEYPSSD